MKTRLYAIVLPTLLAAGAAAAGQAGAPAAMPAVHKQGEVSYVSGGVGRDEATAFRHAAKAWPLELVFVQKTGRRDSYLADIPVTIRDAKRRVVYEGRADGPYFLARLPKGDYTVSARWESWNFTRHLHVGDKHQKVVFEWKKAASDRRA